MSDPCRTAFENHAKFKTKFLFKRGGSVFAENVAKADYVDHGIQIQWEFWQEAWKAALATIARPDDWE